MVFNELRACACIETTRVEGTTSLGFPSCSSLYVTMKVDKVEQLTKKFVVPLRRPIHQKVYLTESCPS